MSAPERVLPCGWAVSALVDLATGDDTAGFPADSRDAEHLRSCPYCQEELVVLRRRWSAVRSAANRRVRTPPGLVGRTLSTVRAVRGGLTGRHAEATQPGGVVRIAESAMMLLARRMARDVVDGLAGVRFRGLSGDLDGLQVRVAVHYGMALAEVTTRVRHDVGAALESTLGAATPPLDVLVEDVLAPRRHR
ncbi:MAG: hypothetical protein M3408_00590 [Actinomycetota bacterium]|nr:hypothetical protein [Actinomycetota bacterium]